MKNKKVFSRFLALVGVAVLMFALAVPCFADAPAPVRQDTVAYTFTDVASFKDFIYSVEDYTLIDRIVLRIDSLGDIVMNDIFLMVDEYTSFFASTSIVSHADSYGVINCFMAWLRWSDEDPEVLTLVDGVINYNNDSSSVSVVNSQLITDGDPFSITVYCLQDFQGTATTKSGLYGQLYNIIADAMYGDGAVLDGTQDFALSLVVTLLVLATVLLPVLLVIGIMFRSFRW